MTIDFRYKIDSKWFFRTIMGVWIPSTLQGTNISPKKWHFEDDFPNFPRWDMYPFPGGYSKLWCLPYLGSTPCPSRMVKSHTQDFKQKPTPRPFPQPMAGKVGKNPRHGFDPKKLRWLAGKSTFEGSGSLGWDPFLGDQTMENLPWMKIYILLKEKQIFQCHSGQIKETENTSFGTR